MHVELIRQMIHYKWKLIWGEFLFILQTYKYKFIGPLTILQNKNALIALFVCSSSPSRFPTVKIFLYLFLFSYISVFWYIEQIPSAQQQTVVVLTGDDDHILYIWKTHAHITLIIYRQKKKEQGIYYLVWCKASKMNTKWYRKVQQIQKKKKSCEGTVSVAVKEAQYYSFTFMCANICMNVFLCLWWRRKFGKRNALKLDELAIFCI